MTKSLMSFGPSGSGVVVEVVVDEVASEAVGVVIVRAGGGRHEQRARAEQRGHRSSHGHCSCRYSLIDASISSANAGS